VHTAPAAPFVLHRTTIGKAHVKFWNQLPMAEVTFILIVIFHFSIEKAAMSAPLFWKECPTGTGQGVLVFAPAFPNVNEI
jgi:hypothetical protein